MSNGNRPSSGMGGLSGLMNNAQLVWRLMQDDRVSTPLKVIIPLLVGLYFISPVDMIPDFIPALGQLDDIGVILLGMTLFINLAPKNVVAEHRQALGHYDSADSGPSVGNPTRPMGRNKVVDTTYRDTENS